MQDDVPVRMQNTHMHLYWAAPLEKGVFEHAQTVYDQGLYCLLAKLLSGVKYTADSRYLDFAYIE